jgi:hypothetical protein
MYMYIEQCHTDRQSRIDCIAQQDSRNLEMSPPYVSVDQFDAYVKPGRP